MRQETAGRLAEQQTTCDTPWGRVWLGAAAATSAAMLRGGNAVVSHGFGRLAAPHARACGPCWAQQDRAPSCVALLGCAAPSPNPHTPTHHGFRSVHGLHCRARPPGGRPQEHRAGAGIPHCRGLFQQERHHGGPQHSERQLRQAGRAGGCRCGIRWAAWRALQPLPGTGQCIDIPETHRCARGRAIGSWARALPHAGGAANPAAPPAALSRCPAGS